MPEASARLRSDPTLAGRSRSEAGRKSFAAVVVSLWRRLGATPARGYAAAALTAALVGIVVNALALQHARHPAPFFARTPVVAAAPTPTPAAALAPTAAETPTAPTPPTRPAQLGGDDAIADMLRADQEQEAQKRLAAAQTALVKLGYVLKADGEPSAATSTALRDFERAHGLPPSNDVTPRLLKTLSAAVNVAGR
ncbi:MAG: peptidoglycan-binding domain-containing protein [Roseiarcus sp.]|uniref:peptidoglycan-binding domain-containing protein n=1 Tax=Roseiarcus sp. TaxID=1969460 RepID=UPI003C296C19